MQLRRPLRIAIIECDNPAFQSIVKRGKYGGIFTSLLKAAAPQAGLREEDLEFSVFNVVKNTTDYPRLEDIDGVLYTGSKYNAYDDNPWTNKLVAFAEEILAQDRIKTIGVCYGHQVVGRAMGVKCAPSDKGWEVSVSKVDLSEEGKRLFQRDTLVGTPINRELFTHCFQIIQQMHKDIVYDCPAGVKSLGSSPLCEIQGMYAPGRLITVQGHPEFTQDIMQEILDARHDRGLLSNSLYEDASERSSKPHDGLVIAAAFLRFMAEGR